MPKPLIISFMLIFISITCFGQFASLVESPIYVKGKKNFYQDTASKTITPIEHLDSLYKEGKNEPFQVLGNKINGDSAIWIVVFFKISNEVKEKWIGQTFPLEDYKDLLGKQINKEDLAGRNLIINCWSITCGPCIKEIPQLNLLVDSLKNSDFRFLALTFDEPVAIVSFFKSQKLKDFFKTQNPEFKFDIVPNQKQFLDYSLGVKSYPTTFIVDKTGKVRAVFEGVNLDKAKEVKTYEEIMAAVHNLN